MATINDLVLVHYEDKPLFFARIEDISPDAKRDWYQVKLLVLQVPVQTVTWILRDAYINGDEYTMGGNRMRLEKVEAPADDSQIETPETEPSPDAETGEQVPEVSPKGTVISFDRMKSKKP